MNYEKAFLKDQNQISGFCNYRIFPPPSVLKLVFLDFYKQKIGYSKFWLKFRKKQNHIFL